MGLSLVLKCPKNRRICSPHRNHADQSACLRLCVSMLVGDAVRRETVHEGAPKGGDRTQTRVVLQCVKSRSPLHSHLKSSSKPWMAWARWHRDPAPP